MSNGDNFQVDGLVEQRKELDALMMSNPETEKRVQKLIRKVLGEVRRAVSKEAKYNIKSDPRQAYKAVKTAVYKRILGGSVSLLSRRNAKGGNGYTPQRTLKPGQWGGNRRPASARTKKINSYQGADRGFILRFLNAGTGSRSIQFLSNPHRAKVNRGSQGGNLSKYGKTINTGRRGSIRARNFFANSSQSAMEKAAEQLGQLIDDMIKKEMK